MGSALRGCGGVAIAESGVTGPADARRLADAGYHAVLVGDMADLQFLEQRGELAVARAPIEVVAQFLEIDPALGVIKPQVEEFEQKAFDVRLGRGLAEQGAAMVGQAPSGTASLTLDGQAVAMDADGNFLIAFDRDAPAAARLVGDLVAVQEPPIPAAPFAPARYGL